MSNALKEKRIFNLTVKHSLTSLEAIEQSGQITAEVQENLEHFKSHIIPSGHGEIEYEATYFHFAPPKRTGPVEDIIRMIISEDPQDPWEPAALEHLLAFGKQHPTEQELRDIYAPGTKIERSGDNPPLIARLSFITEFDSRRISLLWWKSGMFDQTFLAVRRKK